MAVAVAVAVAVTQFFNSKEVTLAVEAALLGQATAVMEVAAVTLALMGHKMLETREAQQMPQLAVAEVAVAADTLAVPAEQTQATVELAVQAVSIFILLQIKKLNLTKL